MRVVALAAFVCALGLSLPCAAQLETTQAELPQTSSVAKQSRPPAPVLVSPEPEVTQPQRSEGSFSAPERLVDWVYNYHAHPTPWRVPAAVRAMRELGLFTDEEKGAFCTGFIAGVLGSNPKDGSALVGKMLPMPDKDQAVLIRAIAFSGRPDWREFLTKYKDRMPLRQPLIDSYPSGKAKTLMEIDLSDGPS